MGEDLHMIEVFLSFDILHRVADCASGAAGRVGLHLTTVPNNAGIDDQPYLDRDSGTRMQHQGK